MKRNMIWTILLTIIMAMVALPAWGAIDLHRIAVLPFDDGSIKKTWGEEYSLGEGVADELVTYLLETNRFRIIEREEVNKVLEEQNLGKDGLIDPQTAAKIGKILGVQYLVIGRITEFTTKDDNDILANPNDENPMGMIITTSTSRVAIDARMVDAATAEILTGVTGTGKKKTVDVGIVSKQGGMYFGDKDFEKTDLGKALRMAVVSTARQLAVKAYEGMTGFKLTGMIAYVSPDRIIINIGKKDGVEPGMVFKVAHKIETINDPITGEAIGEATEPIAEISVVKVKDKSATCNILTKINDQYEISVADPVESKTEIQLALPELPPLEEEKGSRNEREFRLYADWTPKGEYTDSALAKDEEIMDSSIAFIGGQAIFGRFKLAGECSLAGKIDIDSSPKIDVSEYKLGYNLNPVQDMQIELFISKFDLEVKSGADELLHCSSWMFGVDTEYEIAEKTFFEISYGYGASIDYWLDGSYKTGGSLGTLKGKFSYYFSDHAAVYIGYRSYMMKIDDEQDLTGITIGAALKY
jgi:curli biogenesis system outer membrane secretion channel CsgG